MEDYQIAFIDEANEFVGILEESLLQLETDRQNPEILNEIFRIMHSLKGSGAMFGFDDLSNLTHHLESLYDQVRHNEISINRSIIDFTFESVDNIKNLIGLNPEDKYIRKNHELIERIPDLSSIIDDADNDQKINQRNLTGRGRVKRKNDKNTYFIRFIPDKDIFKDGTNPLYLIDELVNMGQSIVKARTHNIPEIDLLNPVECYISWDIVLATTDDSSSIEDVFIFVSESSSINITKLAEYDFTENKTLHASLDENLSNPEILTDDLIDLFESFDNTIEDTEADTVEPNGENVLQSEIQIPEKTERLTARKLRVSTVRVKSENLDNLINLVSELVTMQARLQNLAQENGDLELISFAENFQKLSRQFRDLSFEMRLVPLHNLFVKFQRLIHDVSNDLNKEVEFVTEGLETELDKNVIEHISEPILHILRNSLDHGIEDHTIRKQLNKPDKATIMLKAFYSGADVIIELSDDGKGIDPLIIREKAIEKRIIQSSEEKTNGEILNLIFEPGFSTKTNVSDLSGRGVGMDVVKRKIEELRGSVDIKSEPGNGTTVIIRLPLTLSMIDGFLIKIDGSSFIVPLTSIEKIHELKQGELAKSFNQIIDIGDEQIPYIHLISENNQEKQTCEPRYIVLINYENKKVGLVVNEVMGEYQVVLKPLGHLMKTTDYYSGATIMGNGEVALVIDTNKLIQRFAH